jgi:ribosome-associated translation inhibitor RaiA
VALARLVRARAFLRGVIMPIPTEISFNGIEHSDAVEQAVERWVARLEHMYDRITKCVVTVAQPHKRHRHGSEFSVSVVLEIPGREIAATHLRHEDIYIAVADAFRAARRQLGDSRDVRRGFVKTNVVTRDGRVGLNLNKQRTAM